MNVSMPAEETLAKNVPGHDVARVLMNVLGSPEIIQSWRGEPSGGVETMLSPRKSTGVMVIMIMFVIE
jgi:hypothetical protein